MQTKDHKLLANFLITNAIRNIPLLYKKAFLIGNIEPDINLFTYLRGIFQEKKFRGHNYENVIPLIKKEFNYLKNKNSFGIKEYYILGKLTHYTADIFTFPHNKLFNGSLLEHAKYEKKLHIAIKDTFRTKKNVLTVCKPLDSFVELLKFHKEYLKYQNRLDFYNIDVNYIIYVTKLVFDTLVNLENVSIIKEVEENEGTYNYRLVPANH